MIQSEELPDHFLYPKSTMKEADAVAYVFLSDKGEPVQYPFMFPELYEDEVRIQIHYVGLCQSDCSHVRLKWTEFINYPACPGHEIVGCIEQLGVDVTTFKIGDRVACNIQRGWCGKCEQCLEGYNNLCSQYEEMYEPYFGGYSTHVQLSSKAVFPLPEGIKMELAAPLLCAGATVFAPLKKYGKTDFKCAIIGIGGLGHMAIQYASKMGMIVTAFTSHPEFEQTLIKLGASSVISSIDLDQLRLHEGQYNIVINTLNTDDEKLHQALQRLTKIRGTFVQLGIPKSQAKLQLDFLYMIQKEIHITGSFIASYLETLETLRYSNEHNIYPLVEIYDFDQFPAAFKQLEEGKPKFRCVVNVKDWWAKHKAQ